MPFSLLPVLFGSKMVLQEAQWAYEPSGVASAPAPHSGHFRAMLIDRAAASVCREERGILFDVKDEKRKLITTEVVALRIRCERTIQPG